MERPKFSPLGALIGFLGVILIVAGSMGTICIVSSSTRSIPSWTIYFVLMFIAGLGMAIYSTKVEKEYNSKVSAYAADRLSCPKCNRKSALELNIINKNYSRDVKEFRRTRSSEKITTSSVSATVNEYCKYCNYKSNDFTFSHQNRYSDEWGADADGSSWTNNYGSSEYPSDEEIKIEWRRSKSESW